MKYRLRYFSLIHLKSIMSSSTKIKNVALNITYVNTNKLPTTLEKVCFVCINTYVGTNMSLGDGPMNDGYNIAKCLKRYGYTVYYLLNPKKSNFLAKLEFFFKNVKSELVVYYTGHGTSVRDTNGDEADGYDEAMVFVDGNIIDDTLVETLIEHKNTTNKCVLMSDCCHSGTIWDIQGGDIKGRKLPDDVMSISAASDKQTAKQTVVERLEQGMFTYNIMKILKAEPNLSATECKTKLTSVLRKYGQTVTLGATTASMLTDPLF